MQNLDELLTWQMGIFVVGIVVISYFVRHAVEFFWPALRPPPGGRGTWWTELAMPAVPVVVGVLLALACRKYPFPAPIASASSRVLLGLAAGWGSGWIFRMVKAVIKKKLGVDVPDSPQNE